MNTLKIPILKTEHYSKAFGHTIPPLNEKLKNTKHTTIEKRTFSMLTPTTEDFLQQNKERDTIILSGIETHVCILQTSLDLLERGYKVVLVTDGVSSQRKMDREIAIERVREEGGVLTTAESLVYEIMRTSLCGEFKEILGFIKERNANKEDFF